MTVRVLLADDHRMLRESLRRALTDEGVEVVGEAADGAEAVHRALSLRPDVILMDVTMPGTDGIEATRRIVERWPEARVVMLTMHADADMVADAVRAGAVGYLVKDTSVEEVVEAVRMAASGETVLSAELAGRMLDEVRRLSEAGDEDVLSPREVEVLQLVADGCSTPEIAERLYISQKTVKNHLASIYHKLDARDRTQAVLTAVRRGIVKLR